jgi:hypothetical protein
MRVGSARNAHAQFKPHFDLVALLVPDVSKDLGLLQENITSAGSLVYFSFITLTTTG